MRSCGSVLMKNRLVKFSLEFVPTPETQISLHFTVSFLNTLKGLGDVNYFLLLWFCKPEKF